MYYRKINCILLFLAFSFCSGSISAQFDGEGDDLELPSDSTAAPLQRNTLQTFKAIFAGKPGRTALYGILIPGGGQLYNKRYWKAPIVWAADAAAIIWYIDARQEYRNFRDAYVINLNGGNVTYRGISNTEALRQNRNQFQLQSERAGITIVALHLVSMIEAFTDRHLMNFDVDENLSLGVKSPEFIPFIGSVSSVGLHYTF